MPIVGETVWSLHDYNTSDDYYTATWDFRFPPAPKFVQVNLSLVSDFGDGSTSMPYIQSIRRRLPDGTDEPVYFSDPWNSIDYIQAWFEWNLSGFTVGLFLIESWANVMIVLEDWG